MVVVVEIVILGVVVEDNGVGAMIWCQHLWYIDLCCTIERTGPFDIRMMLTKKDVLTYAFVLHSSQKRAL